MSVKVFHSQREGEYQLVANVNAPLNRVFELTNHITHSWFENPEVEVVQESRSSSVGDVFQTEDGKYHRVAGIGFREVPASDIPAIFKTNFRDAQFWEYEELKR